MCLCVHGVCKVERVGSFVLTLGFEKAENLRRGLKVSEPWTVYVKILKYIV